MITNELCEDLLTYAKLPLSGYHRLNQTITFCQDFNKENYSIFQVNKEILKALEAEKSNSEPFELSIKGSDVEQAVLCTDDRTFEISERETSNTLLIVPHLEIKASETVKENEQFNVIEIKVISSCNKIYDLKERRSKIGEVYKLLEGTKLSHHIGDEFSERAMTFSVLLEKVLMSRLELQSAVDLLKIYTYGDGRLRMLDVDYTGDLITRIIDSALEDDRDVRCISQHSIHRILDQLFPATLLDQTLAFYFTRVSMCQEDSTWAINDIEISKCFAERVLNQHAQMSLDSFMVEWIKKLPEEIKPSLSNLGGLAMINDRVSPQSIKLLKSVTLPDDPEARFKELFAQKSHWKQEELERYVEDLVPKNGSAAQLLLRHCRCSTLDKTKVFSKR